MRNVRFNPNNRCLTPGGSRVREQVFRRVFGYYDNLFETMRKTTRIPPRTLWDNLAHVMVLDYQNWCEESDSVAVRDQFHSDLESLQDPIGGLDTATLSSFMTEYSRRQNRGGQFVRTTCCLNFRLEEYCRECPLQSKRIT